MPVLALVAVLCVLLGGSFAIAGAVRGRRTPTELRGDWWMRFEREFRAYARSTARSRQRHGRDGGEIA